MSWLSQATGWIGDRTGIHGAPIAHAAGNFADNKWTKAALAAGLAASGVGAPLGALIMGAEGLGAGALHEGGGLRDAFTGAVKGAGYGAAAASAGGAVRSAFAPSSSAAILNPGAGGSAGGSSFMHIPGIGELPSNISSAASSAAPAASGGGGFSFGNAANGVGSFIKNNPTAVGMGLQGAGQIASAGANNDLARANAHRTTTEADAADYDLQQKKNRDAALEPIRQMLAGQLSSLRANRYGIAPNPYTGV